MASIGLLNELEVVKEVDFGMYLDGGEKGEILIPKRYIPEGTKVGDTLEVFLYLDSEDRLLATTEKPLVMVDEFAMLKVISVAPMGAFLDWGLPKDLLVPFREQQFPMEEGRSYLVFVYVDGETQRIVASSKLDKFVDNLPVDYEAGEEVDLIIASKTDLGYKAIIDNSHWGLIFKNEVFQPLKIGDRMRGFIKQVRPDDKIDLVLQKPGYEKIDSIAQSVLDKLKDAGGYLPANDKTDPTVVSKLFGISKKNFKKAVGSLYKQRLITIEDEGIRLV